MRRLSLGFTLIESLVALAVLSVGLLGAASMLLASLGDQSRAVRYQSALVVVSDVAERIRANPAGAAYVPGRPENFANGGENRIRPAPQDAALHAEIT